jgi:DNA-binding SARP family transcriptional activator/transcriptional regulator with XRE-family HTH domain/tetratricopeptide (TPR) repeat protein
MASDGDAPGPRGGTWLLRLRIGAGMTQEQLATAAGVSVRTIRELERGASSRPRAQSLHRLAAALGIDPQRIDELTRNGARPVQAVDSGSAREPDPDPDPDPDPNPNPAAGESVPAAGSEPRRSQDTSIHVDVLGPLSVRRGTVPIPLRSPLLRTLLGLLAVQPDRIAGVEEIVDTLWGEDPPRSCRALVHTYISSLRRSLDSAPPAGASVPSVVRREPTGYRLRLGSRESDAARFADLLARARRAAASEPQAAWQLYGEALDCWRGELLAGEGAWRLSHPVAVSLAALRPAVALEWADVGLSLGYYQRTVPLLQALRAQDPLHEGLAASLMLALAGEGRQASALSVFEGIRRQLDDALGIEPGRELRQAQLRVLRGTLPPSARLGPAKTAGTRAPDRPEPVKSPQVPAQLPADISGFAGRARELRALDAALAHQEGGGSPIAILTGMGGVGKSALAVRWSRSSRKRFPDGVLFADLHGHGAGPAARPLDVLAGFISALGYPADRIPVDGDQAAALLRSLLDGKRMLVLLDDAANAEHVRPLLPGSGGCATLITARSRLGGLVARDGAALLEVRPLSTADSVDLLTRSIGGARVQAEPTAVTELAALCAHLPLALRIAAANLAIRPTHRLADQVARLGSGDLLDALAVEGDPHSAVRATFAVSCAALDPADLRVFRLMGLMPGTDLTAQQAGALADRPAAATAAALERLADRNLLFEHLPGRFRIHDLLRLYADELSRRAEAEDPRTAALDRLAAYFLAGTARAAALLYPHLLRLPDAEDDLRDLPTPAPAPTPAPIPIPIPPLAGPADGWAAPDLADRRTALAWLDAERSNLIALTMLLSANGATGPALHLADRLTGYFLVRGDRVHWPGIARAALSAAITDGRGTRIAMAWLQCGMATSAAADYGAAVGHYKRAVREANQAGWDAGAAVALNNLATALWAQGWTAEAVEHLDEALALHRRSGRTAGEAMTLANIGAARLELARRLGPSLSSPSSSPRSPFPFPSSPRLTGDLATEPWRDQLLRALEALEQAQVLHQAIGDRRNEANTLRLLAEAHRDLGDDKRALDHARTSLAIAVEAGDLPYQSSARSVLGTLLARAGDVDHAMDQHRQALDLAQRVDAARETCEALLDLADTYATLGRADDASMALVDAHAVAVRAGSALLRRRSERAQERISGGVPTA